MKNDKTIRIYHLKLFNWMKSHIDKNFPIKKIILMVSLNKKCF